MVPLNNLILRLYLIIVIAIELRLHYRLKYGVPSEFDIQQKCDDHP